MKKKEKSKDPAEAAAAKPKTPATRKAAAPKATAAAKAAKAPHRKMQKDYPTNGGTCRVTFMLPPEATEGITTVTLVGDFNGWDQNKNPLKRQKDGSYAIVLELDSGNEYRFRYLMDGVRWENDWCADKYLPNPHGCDDSVVIT